MPLQKSGLHGRREHRVDISASFNTALNLFVMDLPASEVWVRLRRDSIHPDVLYTQLRLAYFKESKQ